MKKLLFTCLALMAFMLPLVAQVDHDYNPNDEAIPESGFELKNEQVPLSVRAAMKVDFKMENPATWTKFPYALHEYGWVYDKAASDVKPDFYRVTMKTAKGRLSAVYSAKGDLVSTREESTNIEIPPYVLESLSKSKYKDWTVIGNKEIIKYYHDKSSVEQHIRLTLAKDNVVRSISFNYHGDTK